MHCGVVLKLTFVNFSLGFFRQNNGGAVALSNKFKRNRAKIFRTYDFALDLKFLQKFDGKRETKFKINLILTIASLDCSSMH